MCQPFCCLTFYKERSYKFICTKLGLNLNKPLHPDVDITDVRKIKRNRNSGNSILKW